jgi:RNA polymerase sigma-70 factor (ECF subfamily)
MADAQTAMTDADVVARVLAGETALFEILLRRYNQRLFRIARSILRSDDDAEDAVQQAYINAFTHLGQFAGDAAFATWLTRIAIHEALARTRQRTRRAETDLEEQEQMNRLVSDRRSPEEQAADRELTGLVEAAVDELPELYRTVFMMREVQQLSTAETAACLEVSEESVKVRLHRAKAMLRDNLASRVEAGAGLAFQFLGARCDRLVAKVMGQISTK